MLSSTPSPRPSSTKHATRARHIAITCSNTMTTTTRFRMVSRSITRTTRVDMAQAEMQVVAMFSIVSMKRHSPAAWNPRATEAKPRSSAAAFHFCMKASNLSYMARISEMGAVASSVVSSAISTHKRSSDSQCTPSACHNSCMRLWRSGVGNALPWLRRLLFTSWAQQKCRERTMPRWASKSLQRSSMNSCTPGAKMSKPASHSASVFEPGSFMSPVSTGVTP
mmetsp:Transcript_138150/g.385413  ORF Transcript_138150/g.385413 Transcript_138150/m.385413 type:complete len:223 (-) Transcript_138150:309-977(-)